MPKSTNRRDIINFTKPSAESVKVNDALFKALCQSHNYPTTLKKLSYQAGIDPLKINIQYKSISGGCSDTEMPITTLYGDKNDTGFLRILMCPDATELNQTGLNERHKNLILVEPTQGAEIWSNSEIAEISGCIKIAPERLIFLAHDLMLDISIANSFAFRKIVEAYIDAKGRANLYAAKAEFAYETIPHSENNVIPRLCPNAHYASFAASNRQTQIFHEDNFLIRTAQTWINFTKTHLGEHVHDFDDLPKELMKFPKIGQQIPTRQLINALDPLEENLKNGICFSYLLVAIKKPKSKALEGHFKFVFEREWKNNALKLCGLDDILKNNSIKTLLQNNYVASIPFFVK